MKKNLTTYRKEIGVFAFGFLTILKAIAIAYISGSFNF